MATAAVDEEDVTMCTVCLEQYTDPCTLQCKHSFCRKCITNYTKTQEDAIRNKTIPCPSCRQVTEVPDPSKPVSKWAGQLQPGHVVQKLMARINKDTFDGTPCFPCQRLGVKTSGKFWCGECEAAFCQRCAKTHRAQPNSGSHYMHDIKDKHKARRGKAKCSEHIGKLLDLYCKDCNISHCHLCFVEHHRRCEDVLTLNSFVSDMKTDLYLLDNQLEEQEDKSKSLVEITETRISQLNEDKISGYHDIRLASERAIKLIKIKEKLLKDQMEKITNRETNELKAKVKEGHIQMQTCRQYREYIKQALSSDSESEVCNVYQAWKSGQLDVSQDVAEAIKENNPSVLFSQENQNVTKVLDSLHLGEIVRYLPSDLMTGVEFDEQDPSVRYVVVLEVEDVHTAVVTDYNNQCVKSFYTMNNKICHSRLRMSNSPWGLTIIDGNKVMVAVSDSRQIVTVAVNPSLVQVDLIHTSKEYSSLAVMSPSGLAAGGHNFVDILNMQGDVLKSVKINHEMQLYEYFIFMCVSNTGHLLVSDWKRKTITCLTSKGKTVWIYSGTRLSNPRGITTTSEGDILVADRDQKKVIQLSHSGEYVGDFLNSKDGLCTPFGIFADKHGSLFICDSGKVKLYQKGNSKQMSDCT